MIIRSKYFLYLISLICVGCATLPRDLKRTQFQLGHSYLFTNNNASGYLSIKLLTDTNPKARRLIAKRMIKPDMTPPQSDDPSIMKIDNYYINEKGQISFRYYENKDCREMIEQHPVCKAASSERGGRCSVWYLLDYEEAKQIE